MLLLVGNNNNDHGHLIVKVQTIHTFIVQKKAQMLKDRNRDLFILKVKLNLMTSFYFLNLLIQMKDLYLYLSLQSTLSSLIIQLTLLMSV